MEAMESVKNQESRSYVTLTVERSNEIAVEKQQHQIAFRKQAFFLSFQRHVLFVQYYQYRRKSSLQKSRSSKKHL